MTVVTPYAAKDERAVGDALASTLQSMRPGISVQPVPSTLTSGND